MFGTFTLAIDKAIRTTPEAECLMGLLAFMGSEAIPLDIIDQPYLSGLEKGEAVAALSEVSLINGNELEDGQWEVSVHRLVQQVMRDRLSEHGEFDRYARSAIDLIARAFPALPVANDILGWARCDQLAPHAAMVLARAREMVLHDGSSAALNRAFGAYLAAKADFNIPEHKPAYVGIGLESVARPTSTSGDLRRARGRAALESASLGASTEREAVLAARLQTAEETLARIMHQVWRRAA